MAKGQTPSGAATPSRLPTQTTAQTRSLPPPPPSPPRNDDVGEVSKNAQSKKQKTIVAEDSPIDPVLATFGLIASRNYTKEDVKTLQGRNDEEGKFAFKDRLGDAFYHGLKVLNLKNSLIRDQDRSLKRLGNEVQTMSSKMGEIQKKAAEKARLLKEDAEKARTEPEYDWSVHFPPSTPAFMVKLSSRMLILLRRPRRKLRNSLKRR